MFTWRDNDKELISECIAWVSKRVFTQETVLSISFWYRVNGPQVDVKHIGSAPNFHAVNDEIFHSWIIDLFGFEQLDFWIRRMTVCSNEV